MVELRLHVSSLLGISSDFSDSLSLIVRNILALLKENTINSLFTNQNHHLIFFIYFFEVKNYAEK
jgi:hypothetical protein